MSSNKYMPFSLQEYKDRIVKIREGMESQDIDVLLINCPENLYYLTGYASAGYYTYQTLILPLEKDPIMEVRIIEQQALERTWIENHAYYTDEQNPIEVAAEAIKETKLDGKTIGVEKRNRKAFLTINEFEELQKRLPNARFVDGSDIIENCRLIKSERELEYARQAAKIVEKTMWAGINSIEVGKYDYEVTAEINRALLVNGSEYPASLPGCSFTGIPHVGQQNIKLQKGQIVRLEIGASVKRYHAALTRTVSLGELSAEAKKLEEASGKTLEKAIEVIKPGIEAQDAHRAIQGELRRLGYGELHKHRSAYSIGIAIAHAWSEEALSINEGERRKLQPGMVFHMVGAGLIVPGKYMLSTGSETIAVKEEGNEVLTNFPRKVFIK